MFRTLRGKLIASHTLVVVICLLLAGASMAVMLRGYRQRLVLAELQSRAGVASFRLGRYLERYPLSERAPRLRQAARELGVRFLLLSAEGLVLYDSEGGIEGQRIAANLGQTLEEPKRPPLFLVRDKDGEGLYVMPLPLTLGRGRFAALVVPAREMPEVTRKISLRLVGAGLVGLFISVGISVFLARSITHPLAALTRASEEMARGRYDQVIPVEGEDEVARLAERFNAMAKEIGRARKAERDFLANVSHDLKTPLTSIVGFSQAIMDGLDEEKAAQVINQEAERMSRMVDQLLELARLEAGVAAKVESPVDLLAVLRRCGEDFRSRLEKKGVSLEVDLPERLPQVRGDPDMLARLFANLLDNGLKYTPQGGRVTLSARLASPRAVEVAVADTGPGIPPDSLSRIFDRFYRLERHRPGGEGLGLGLAIAREIAETHGGKIRAESEPGQGAKFIVSLPLP
ncbi:MAG: sensor histidine kinase [Anaerolineae bacterium]